MPLRLTKVAFGATCLDHLTERLIERSKTGPLSLTTRNLPRRHEEIAGRGSLFWIIRHQLVARSPILFFGEAGDGKRAIHIDPQLVRVDLQPKRAHQGWRYLEAADAPGDLTGDAADAEQMPAAMMSRIAALSLL